MAAFVIAKAEGLWRSMHGLPRFARNDDHE
jgi:hypothetical protein